jgi:hypothetical protein
VVAATPLVGVAAMSLVPSATFMVTTTPVVVLIIVVTMTRSDVYATRPNVHADVGTRRSGLWSGRYTH